MQRKETIMTIRIIHDKSEEAPGIHSKLSPGEAGPYRESPVRFAEKPPSLQQADRHRFPVRISGTIGADEYLSSVALDEVKHRGRGT